MRMLSKVITIWLVTCAGFYGAKAQTISGSQFVCPGAIESYNFFNSGCNVNTIRGNIVWNVTNGSLPPNAPNTTSLFITWSNNSSISNGSVAVTYDCDTPGRGTSRLTTNLLNVDIFHLATPSIITSSPINLDCGSQGLSFATNPDYTTFQSHTHPLVNFHWTHPNCWTSGSINTATFSTTTDNDGFGDICVTVGTNGPGGSCPDNKSNCMQITRNPQNITFTSSPLPSSVTKGGFIEASGTAKVPSGSGVTFTAGNFIKLLPNFKAESGSVFLARISGGCSPVFCASTLFERLEEPDYSFTDNSIYGNMNASRGATGTGKNITDVSIRVYPNPFSNNFVVDFEGKLPGKEWDLSVYDLLGKLVYRKVKLTAGKHELDTREWKPGAFFVKVNSAEISKDIKLVKVN